MALNTLIMHLLLCVSFLHISRCISASDLTSDIRFCLARQND